MRVADLAADLLLGLAARDPLLGAPGQMLEHRRGGRRMAAEPELEPVADGTLDQPGRLGRDQPVLGLALELRLAQEQRQQDAGAAGGVLGGDRGGAPEADPLGVGAQTLQQRGAQAGLVGAAGRGGHRVAVPAGIGLLVDRPGDRPLDAAVLLQRRLAGERVVDHELAPVEQRLEEVGEALRESGSSPRPAPSPSAEQSAGSQRQRISTPRNR